MWVGGALRTSVVSVARLNQQSCYSQTLLSIKSTEISSDGHHNLILSFTVTRTASFLLWLDMGCRRQNKERCSLNHSCGIYRKLRIFSDYHICQRAAWIHLLHTVWTQTFTKSSVSTDFQWNVRLSENGGFLVVNMVAHVPKEGSLLESGSIWNYNHGNYSWEMISRILNLPIPNTC